MKIVVIGGHGYLGAHVARYFKAPALSRNNGFDVTNRSLMQKLQDYDVIIHMAAKVDKTDKTPREVFRINAEGTKNIASSLQQRQTLILTSTKEVHTPGDSYSYSKLEAEKLAKECSQCNGFRLGIFRLSTTYAPPSNGSGFVNYFVECIKKGKELQLLMEGKQIRDFLYVDDLSLAFERFIKSSLQNGVWDIGGGKKNSTTILGLTGIISQVVNKLPRIKFSSNPVRGQMNYITPLKGIKKDLEWAPTISLEEGIKKII